MRFSLLILGLLSGAVAQAQHLPTPSTLPGPRVVPMGLASTAARTTAAVTLPGRSINYAWNAANQTWVNALVTTSTYDAEARPLVTLVADSATQVPQNRTTQTYTANGQTSTQLYETWNGSFTPNSLFTATYDAQERITGRLSQIWQNGAWQNTDRSSYSYDTQGNQTEAISYEWRNNAWVITYATQTTYVYTAAGAIQELISAVWSPITAGYVPEQRHLYTYGTNPQQWTTMTIQTPVGGSFANSMRYINPLYDAQGRQTVVESEMWMSGSWQLSNRYITTYATGGPGHVFVMQNRVSNNWVNNYRYTSSYDAQGNPLTEVSENWRNNAWVPSYGWRYLLRYNAAGLVDQRVGQQVNAATGTFVNSLKTRYSNFQTITLATKPTARLLAATSLYPNPASRNAAPTLVVEGLREQAPATVAVLNSLGQVVHTQRVRVQQGRIQEQLSWGALPAGLYTVRVQTADGVTAKTLVQQ